MHNGATTLSAYFLHAIQDWIDALGAEYVVTDSGSRLSAQTATFSTESKIPAILRPANREQVQACLRIAQRHQVPVYPISSGKNWGYGSRVPATDNCVLLDLGRLDRILDYDADLGTLTIEPGVTQQQVFDFLKAHGGKFWMDATGASPSCSIIGNTMERGFGHTPYGDHFANACAFEVVLPTGEVLETGFARLPQAKSAQIFRTGFGPAVDGLFTQSNLGVVTRMTLWLMPAPEYFEGFFFQCEDDAQLEGLFEALRPLRLNGTLRSAIHIANDYRVMTSIEQYPWEETGGQTPLTPKMMERVRKSRKFGAWSGSGALYGT
ncbi:MAG: FAD-dependent oxidoreductase, partial [Bryobacter sp.]|nr:FAD-dependent oxidoreductase [Bryobacter sp.]